jgi:hypothetical protein
VTPARLVEERIRCRPLLTKEGENVLRGIAALAAVASVIAVAGCGGDEKKSESEEGDRTVQAACSGSALTAEPKLPASFPQIEADKLTYTQQETNGPTEVIEGYFNGDVEEAHEEFKKELEGVGFDILFDEVEAPNDSEISWKGEGRTGQVALRNQCGKGDKTYVRITNRAA